MLGADLLEAVGDLLRLVQLRLLHLGELLLLLQRLDLFEHRPELLLLVQQPLAFHLPGLLREGEELRRRELLGGHRRTGATLRTLVLGEVVVLPGVHVIGVDPQAPELTFAARPLLALGLDHGAEARARRDLRLDGLARSGLRRLTPVGGAVSHDADGLAGEQLGRHTFSAFHGRLTCTARTVSASAAASPIAAWVLQQEWVKGARPNGTLHAHLLLNFAYK